MWSVHASKHTSIHTHACNEVTLVWGSLRSAPTNLINMHLYIGAIYDFDQLLYCINNVVDQNTSRFWVGDWFSKLRFLVECTCRQLCKQNVGQSLL